MKTCNRCLKTQAFSKFYKRSNRPSGYDYMCKSCKNLQNKKSLLKNPTSKKRCDKKYYKNNKQKLTVARKLYQKTHLAEFAFRTNQRKTKKLNATPKWLTKQQLMQIKDFYKLAKELTWLSESPLQVDHIVPLQGKNFSGLNVPWNLQILPKTLNCAKHNNLEL